MERAEMPDGADALVKRWARAAQADQGATGFVLDFDGTLSPIAPTPAAARPLPDAAPALEALARRYRMVAILSGRRAQDVHDLIPVPGVRYVGLYGAEELEGGRLTEHPLAAERPGAVATLVAAAHELLRAGGLAGCEVEDKGRSVALHYRRAVFPEAGARLTEWAAGRGRDFGFQLRPGRMVVELTPPGPTKADAVERLVGEGLRLAALAGDDRSDVVSLRRAGELLGPGALRIGVRSAEAPPELAAASDVMVEGPEGVVALLGRFA
jgi:trehalose 6-phosphate phosphatase